MQRTVTRDLWRADRREIAHFNPSEAEWSAAERLVSALPNHWDAVDARPARVFDDDGKCIGCDGVKFAFMKEIEGKEYGAEVVLANFPDVVSNPGFVDYLAKQMDSAFKDVHKEPK